MHTHTMDRKGWLGRPASPHTHTHAKWIGEGAGEAYPLHIHKMDRRGWLGRPIHCTHSHTHKMDRKGWLGRPIHCTQLTHTQNGYERVAKKNV